MSNVAKFKVAVIPFVHVGHMNPMLCLVKQLVQRGVEVVFFGESTVKKQILKAGAKYIPLYDGLFDDEITDPVEYFMQLRVEKGLSVDDFGLMRVQEAYEYLDPLMENIKREMPDVILHDTFCVEAYVLSKVLDIPLISHISYSGLGIFGDGLFEVAAGRSWQETLDEERHCYWRELYKKRFNVDIWSENLPLQYYSTDMMVTTLIEELCLPLNPEVDTIVHKYFGKREAECQVFVGPCFDEENRINGKPAHLEKPEERFPIEKVVAAKESGKKIVLASFGTVITENLWDVNLWQVGGVGTGQKFVKKVTRHVVEALGENDEFFVVMVMGLRAKGLENDIPVPSNFLVVKKVPQMEVLKLADCFISHMGANSMNEALDAGVPLVPVPGFADQMTNGKVVVNAGAGFVEWDLDESGKSCTTEGMRRAVFKVTQNPEYALKSKAIGDKGRNSGGAKEAAELMIQFISKVKDSKNSETAFERKIKVPNEASALGYAPLPGVDGSEEFSFLPKPMLTRVSSG